MIKEMQRKKKILSFSKKQRKELRSVARSKRHNIRLPDPTSPVEFPRFSICASRVLSLGHSSSPSSSWGVCFSTFASFSQPSSKSSLSSSSAASEFSRKDHNLVRKDNNQPWPISRRSLAPVKDLFHSQSRAFRQNNRAKDKCLVWMDFTDRHKGATNFYFMVTVFFFFSHIKLFQGSTKTLHDVLPLRPIHSFLLDMFDEKASFELLTPNNSQSIFSH